MHDALARSRSSTDVSAEAAPPRIGVVVLACNAPSTLVGAFDALPKALHSRITRVFVGDDASQESTHPAGLGSRQLSTDLPLTVIRHGRRLGYGGKQKEAYRLAIEYGIDIIVLLNAAGEHASECLEDLIAPFESGEADVVLGSRVLFAEAARRGAAPVRGYFGSRILTHVENRMLGTHLSEIHSGYRAYSVRALASIPFERNSDDFAFDTQILLQLLRAGKRAVEVPIPAALRDGMRDVSELTYARTVSVDVVRYWGAKRGLLSGSVVDVGPEYQLKEGKEGSHAVISRWLERIPPARVLDLGCSGGLLDERLRSFGHHVTGVDLYELPGIRERVDRFVRADLDQGLPPNLSDAGLYDVVVAADVLEHLRAPERILDQIQAVLAPRGTLVVSVPNIAHWYPRARIALGLFDYDQRGILDSTHMRFFTQRSFLRVLRQAGFTVLRREATGLPLEVLTRGDGPVARTARTLDRIAVNLRPTLFAYQFVCQCRSSLSR
jgi:2-polyprenyl-3-methyl-5-hydroxy-6-metoxy-1,4-benzoquinol methylase